MDIAACNAVYINGKKIKILNVDAKRIFPLPLKLGTTPVTSSRNAGLGAVGSTKGGQLA